MSVIFWKLLAVAFGSVTANFFVQYFKAIPNWEKAIEISAHEVVLIVTIGLILSF